MFTSYCLIRNCTWQPADYELFVCHRKLHFTTFFSFFSFLFSLSLLFCGLKFADISIGFEFTRQKLSLIFRLQLFHPEGMSPETRTEVSGYFCLQLTKFSSVQRVHTSMHSGKPIFDPPSLCLIFAEIVR